MQLINNTAFQADYSPGFAKDGRRLLVVMIKATYIIAPDTQLQVHQEQQPIVQADISNAEDGYSAVLYESDFATYKPFCDVIFNGCAYVPNDETATQVDVSLQIKDHIDKSFRVIGHRTWGDITASEFSKMSISYDNAFGGTDSTKPAHLRIYQMNPVGTGYSYHRENINDLPLPNTEEFNRSVSEPNGNYKPMAFGVVSRAWPSRACYAGTYDQNWIENTMPFYPDDFDFRYFQCASPDQQMPYIWGGEEVTLINLSSHPRLKFTLPRQCVPVTAIPVKGKPVQYQSCVDTVIIEPEFERLMMVSRAAIPLHNNLFELDNVIVGNVSREWLHQQRAPTKRYYRTLSDLIVNKQSRES